MKTKIIFILLLSTLLSGCFLRPKVPDIQQGNILDDKEINQIQLGMDKRAVQDILGDPVLVSTFDENIWNYVYTFQKNGGKITKQQVILYFQNNRLVKIDHGQTK